MKIAISSLIDISRDNGTSVRAKRVFALLQKKYDCTLIVRGERDSKSENVVVIKPSKFWNFQLIPVFLNGRFDLVYCASDFWGFFTYFALARLLTCKIILEAHGIYSLEKERGLRDPSLIDKVRIETSKWREKFAVKHADCVIALSSDICNYYGRFNKRIFLVPAFVNEKEFRSQKSTSERKSDNYEAKNVGLIGPFVQNNDINSHALDLVYRDIDEFDGRIKFVIIGECDYKIRNERIEYTGYLNDFRDYVNQLTRLDAVLVASRFPTSGPLNKILEPMACSLPVFTTPVGAVGLDHIRSGEDIFISEESKLVTQVNKSLFDSDLMERVGKNARRTIEKYYGIEVNEGKLVAVVEQLSSH
jgi:glycosyltransferase involved in cell wall biosynthesis